MKTLTFNCQVITPMFSGNAFQKAEIRPSEIKAAMRFWWRAMQSFPSLEELKKEEVKIFGGGYKENGEEKSQRSSFDLEVMKGKVQSIKDDLPDHPFTEQTSQGPRTFNILKYLCYGTWDFRRGFIRSYIPVGSRFNIMVSYMYDETLEDIKELLWLTGNISGIGGRSRNGFGKFIIDKINVEDLQSYFTKLRKGRNQSYTSFSSNIKLYETKEHYDSWDKALASIGKIYKECRLGLHNDRHSGQKRIYIGSPLTVDRRMVSKLERHTKLYFLSIIEENEDNTKNYKGIILYMPYDYLRDSIKGQKKIRAAQIASEKSYFDSANKEFNTLLSTKLNTLI